MDVNICCSVTLQFVFSLISSVDPPSFVRRPQNIQADLLENITLVCIVDANPPPDIIWVFDPIDRVCILYYDQILTHRRGIERGNSAFVACTTIILYNINRSYSLVVMTDYNISLAQFVGKCMQHCEWVRDHLQSKRNPVRAR